MDIQAKLPAELARQDRFGFERACLRAARKVAKLHRFHNTPLVVSRNGQITEVSPDEFEKNLDQREAWVNAAEAAEKAGLPVPPFEEQA